MYAATVRRLVVPTRKVRQQISELAAEINARIAHSAKMTAREKRRSDLEIIRCVAEIKANIEKLEAIVARDAQ